MYHKVNIIGGVQFDCTCQKGKRHKKAQAKALQPSQPQLAANSEVKAVEFIDIDQFYNFEARIGTEVIAQLFHDAFAENKGCWVVAVAGVELHRSHLWADSRDWVKLQYEQGKLPQQVASDQTVLLSKSTEVPEQQSSTKELLDKPFDELTPNEWEQLRAQSPVTKQKPLSLNAHLLPSVICHKCDGLGCGYCGYTGLTSPKSPEVYAMDGVKPPKYRFVRSEYTVQTTTLATMAYWCFDSQQKLGMVFRVRNHKCMWQNKTDTFYWTCGDGNQYDSALDVAQALAPELVGV
ncbi:MAG: hypothetical protein H0X31_06095 [Nostocaceae cyanobacterium]|nr:hypothetical protein [Nostocaceae cyanobacterium]